jgi:hypothetical protein
VSNSFNVANLTPYDGEDLGALRSMPFERRRMMRTSLVLYYFLPMMMMMLVRKTSPMKSKLDQ